MFFFLDVAVWWLIIWVVKNAAMDVVHACKGTANPRYELAKAKAKAAGQPSPTPPRYGSREWFADFLSDGLVAQTNWRRERAERKAVEKAKAKAPVDDMLDVVREPDLGAGPTSSVVHDVDPPGRPIPVHEETALDRVYAAFHKIRQERPLRTEPCGNCGGEVGVEFRLPRSVNGVTRQVCPACAEAIDRGHPEWTAPDARLRSAARPDMPEEPTIPLTPSDVSVPADVLASARTALAEEDPQGRRNLRAMDAAWEKVLKVHPDVDPMVIDRALVLADRAPSFVPDTTPIAPVIQLFPTTKEINMANIEATGLPTAIAFAEAAAAAHESFSGGGSEGYIGALEQMEMGETYVGSAREAMEASSVAAAKWTSHAEGLKTQTSGQEFYRNNPDAANKAALIGE